MSGKKIEEINQITTNKAFSRKGFLKVGGGAGLALLAAGCGRQQESSEDSGKSGLVSRGDLKIEFVNHWVSSDAFWTVVKNGVEQAQKDLGVDINSRTIDSFSVPQIQQNFDAAIATQPDGIFGVDCGPKRHWAQSSRGTRSGHPRCGDECWTGYMGGIRCPLLCRAGGN